MKTVLMLFLLSPLSLFAQRWITKYNDDTMGTTMYSISNPKQEHIVRVYTDSCGFTKEITFKAEFEDFICSQCKHKASIWVDQKWYCKHHYKQYSKHHKQ